MNSINEIKNTSTKTHEKRDLHFYFISLFTLGCLSASIYFFDFEPNSPLRTLAPFFPLVFAIHYWLKPQMASPFLLVSGIGSAFFLLNWQNACGLILLGLSFAWFLQMKLASTIKIALSVLLISVLAFLRTGSVTISFLSYAAPVAGSMLMFRGILMLYEDRYHKPQATFWQRASYILLFYNYAFPFFPILDYRQFLNNLQPTSRKAIRTGLYRILAGMMHLILYRIIYLYVIPLHSEIHTAHDTVHYILSGYLLIIHLTGLLWMALGFLGTLGIELTPIFNQVFLIGSFREIWRRVNIYWREFMMKIVYYPVYFRLRKKVKQATLIAALITLTCSALLHGWQWFWIQGSIQLQSSTLLYWFILTSCIAISLARQEKESARKKQRDWKAVIPVFGMYLFMSILWSLWSSRSISDWLEFITPFTNFHFRDLYMILGELVLVFVLLWLGINSVTIKDRIANAAALPLITLSASLCLLLINNPFTKKAIPSSAQSLYLSITQPQFNADDEARRIENYYSSMLSSDDSGNRPWEMHLAGGKAKSGLDEACIRRADMILRELIPSKETPLNGWTICTNEWGMRDKSYSKTKPAGVYRIAILGGSYEMGSGVVQDSIFENLLEKMLADSFSNTKIEILNFAVGGYHLVQQDWVLQHKVLPFQPDLVLCFIHPSESRRNSHYLATLVENGTDFLYPELKKIRQESGVRQGMNREVLVNRFNPYNNQIHEWAIHSLEQNSRANNSALLFVYLPTVSKNEMDMEIPKNTIMLNGVFGTEPQAFALANDPTHPNANGHYQIAVRLSKDLSSYIRLSISQNKNTNGN
jgi:hypothetical protein